MASKQAHTISSELTGAHFDVVLNWEGYEPGGRPLTVVKIYADETVIFYYGGRQKQTTLRETMDALYEKRDREAKSE